MNLASAIQVASALLATISLLIASNGAADQISSPREALKCSPESIILTRQTLFYELEQQINQLSSIWFTDFDKDELLEWQKQSLGNIIMSNSAAALLNGDGQPLMEIEASYFKPSASSIKLRILKRNQNCQLDADGKHFSYTLTLSLGSIEHHLDIIYNLPKELRLSQPNPSWKYGQVKILIPQMNYEVVLKQAANYKLANIGEDEIGGQNCPLQVTDVTYLGRGGNDNNDINGTDITMLTSGLANTNQTRLQLERLFQDYTRPAVSNRLRSALRFHLNGKTLPLWAK